MPKRKSKTQIILDSIYDNEEGRAVAVISSDPLASFDELTAKGFKFDLIRGIFVRESQK